MTTLTKDHLYSEIRYAIRLTERTARLYRKMQAAGYVLTIVGGSAALAGTGKLVPEWAVAIGAMLFVIAGAFLISVRPADKIAQNDADARRYQSLMAKSVKMNETEMEEALEDARLSGAPEVEPLRDVAYNDVVIECNRPDIAVHLSPIQRLLAILA